MAGVMKRIDYACPGHIHTTICFCDKCDENGKGGKGGILLRVPERDIIDDDKKFANFCPTCGEPVDWKNIKTRENYLR